jgi:hypothetical protein
MEIRGQMVRTFSPRSKDPGTSPGRTHHFIFTCTRFTRLVQLDWFIKGRAVCGLPVIHAPEDPLESFEKSIRESTFKVANLSRPLDLETPRALLYEESVSSIVEIHGRVVGCLAHGQRIPGSSTSRTSRTNHFISTCSPPVYQRLSGVWFTYDSST